VFAFLLILPINRQRQQFPMRYNSLGQDCSTPILELGLASQTFGRAMENDLGRWLQHRLLALIRLVVRLARGILP
jgi:hypothetical protein